MNGTLARQELGSMLPVLALQMGGWLKQKSRVLDLCASPGSKTLQAMEIVGEKGRVVANDVHPGRLQSLQEAVERSGMSLELRSRITYTNFDAAMFPFPKSGDKLFDTIICDVPCSGDGTIRKDKHILPMWTPTTANALHALQVRILVRAIQLLKVGGVVSYSTCSLNPVEDEAVVAAALEKVRTTVNTEPVAEIMEWPQLDGFIRREGIKDWRVADYTGESENGVDEEYETGEVVKLRWHDTFEDACNAKMDNAVKSMWPPTEENINLHLERCTRLWPQDQDTGGFFVALIRKNR
jgi:16S rRNA C967 or C1407 C5-methylase (RsmB/RsmF family)